MKPSIKHSLFIFLLFSSAKTFSQKPDSVKLQTATIPIGPIDSVAVDSALRITNLNPYFTLHVDSVLVYDLHINKLQSGYYWYLKNSPMGVRINKDNGLLYIKAEKPFFMTGKLKYDNPYKVQIGVQNLSNPKDKIDTNFTIVFYNTEVIPSRLKPTVNGILTAEEGDSISFQVQCETGSFPIEHIAQASNVTISNFKSVTKCDDFFEWRIPFDFIRDNDSAKQKMLALQFIGNDRFYNRDTVTVKIQVRPGINYPMRYDEHKLVTEDVLHYVRYLKMTFYVLSKTIKNNKGTRTTFDISSSTTALAGTALSSSSNTGTKNVGVILPSVGLALVPVKEAVAPNKVQEQNTATQVRSVIKRLEYLLTENQLVGNRDPEVLSKTKKLRDELKAAQLQLVDLPIEFEGKTTDEEADKYFKSSKVNKKYKIKMD
jgi:hypothetical protein